MSRPLCSDHGPSRLAFVLATAGLAVAALGCSATQAGRLRPAAGTRVTATVGDQAAAPVVGTPDDQITAGADEAAPPRRDPQTRISGRVLDEEGRGVSGATVRLADGLSRAGRDVVATTDGSGGFSLDGLRAGSDYYLVAEAEFADGRGLMVGRTRATTSARRIRIQLGRNTDSRSGDAPNTAVAATDPTDRPARRLARPAPSNSPSRATVDDPADSEPATSRRLPDDDVERASGWRTPGASKPARNDRSGAEPPALTEATDPDDRLELGPDPDPDAEPTSAPARSARRRPPVDQGNPLPMSVAPPTAATEGPEPDEERPQPRRASPRAQTTQADQPSPPFDLSDPANRRGATAELPASPAHRDGPSHSLIASAPAASDPPPLPDIAQSLPLDDKPDGVGPPVVGAVDAAPEAPSAALAASAAAPAPAQVPGLAPTAEGSSPASLPTSPLAGSPPAAGPDPGDSATYNPFALMNIPPQPVGQAATPAAPPEPAPTSRLKPTVAALPPSASGPSTAPDRPTESTPTAPKPMTWGDLAATTNPAPPAAPLAGSGGGSARDPQRPPGPAVGAGPVATRTGFLQGRRSRGATAAALAAPSCNFDPKTNQLRDFQLPAVDGRPVRFRDLDADLVLLDFWGTWCGQCIESIPHLVALQKQYGPGRLRVVGVACENGPASRRAGAVNKATQTLGINYAVVVTSHDGTCPLQNALDVQYFPTMVLLDRAGRVVWRGVGNTDDNLSKLDKAIAGAIGDSAAGASAGEPTGVASAAPVSGRRVSQR